MSAILWNDGEYPMLDDTLCILGYRPEDDSWEADGRRTYINDDDATRAWMTSLGRILARQGWYRREKGVAVSMWSAFHPDGLVIEIEPGGADCSGHYLHLMKASVVAA